MADPIPTNPPPQKSLIERALDGTISSNDFKTFIGDFMRDQNTHTLKAAECTLSKSLLDFANSGNQSPVVSVTSTVTEKDVVTINNNSKKHKVFFEFIVNKNPKFDLKIEPENGEIKKGGKIDIHFSLRVFCTTKIYQMLKIVLSTKSLKDKKKAEKKAEKKPSTSTMKKEPSQLLSPNLGGAPGQDEIGNLYICFKVESMLSNYLDYDELQLLGKIAKGGFGTVYKAIWRTSNVAVKVLNTQEMVDDEKESVKREIELISRLNHAHVVTYMGSTQVEGQPLCIVMEYVGGGCLTDLLKNPLSDKFKCKLALNCGTGMAFLHSNNIFHRDLKPDNLLVVSADPNTAVNLKITDFGTSRNWAKRNIQQEYLSFHQAQQQVKEDVQPHSQDPQRNFTKGVGTLIYQAPELLKGSGNYDLAKTDIYSFGVLLWELFAQREPYSDEPYKAMTKWEIVEFVTSGKRIDIPKDIPSSIQKMITKCWDPMHVNRPSFDFLVKQLEQLHPTLKDDTGNGIPNRPASSNSLTAQSPSVPGLAGLSAQQLLDIAWSGSITREQAEEKLKDSAVGTFLVRWSHNTSCYVLTYKEPGKCQHIAYIRPDAKDGSIAVDKQDGTTTKYDNLVSYVNAMKSSRIIISPLGQKEDLYERSPASK